MAEPEQGEFIPYTLGNDIIASMEQLGLAPSKEVA